MDATIAVPHGIGMTKVYIEETKEMRIFHLMRRRDVSGVSGTGRVAEGIEFHDGQCVLSWFGQHHSIAIYPNLEDLVAIHGHNGDTVIEWEEIKG